MYTEAQKRAHIYDLQRFLRRIQQAQGAACPLAPDGIFGTETAAAVREFQRRHGLPVTGTADFDTWAAIYAEYAALTAGDAPPAAPAFFPAGADSTLSPGDKGASVFVLQLMLEGAALHYPGFPAAPLTGEYDAETAAGVRCAQAFFLLPETGTTDRATWDALTALHNSLFGCTPLAWSLP